MSKSTQNLATAVQIHVATVQVWFALREKAIREGDNKLLLELNEFQGHLGLQQDHLETQADLSRGRRL